MKSVNRKHTNCGKCIFHGVMNAFRLTCNNQEVRKRFIDDLDGYCKHFKVINSLSGNRNCLFLEVEGEENE